MTYQLFYMHEGRVVEHDYRPIVLDEALMCARELTHDFKTPVTVFSAGHFFGVQYPNGTYWRAEKCSFCGDFRPLDKWGHCQACVDGMARTNGD